ncbi:MAG: 50S ribosomal protein L15 [Pirellulales bacterium]|nr:50S ribosomal protein L15 [Pirellulales bacterium]
MNLHDVHQGIKKRTKRLRIGRGTGSGRGKTAGRGHKGQGQLAGWSAHPAFEGGRLPLVRRIPKRGFNNQWARVVFAINVGQLEKLFDAGAEITPELLQERHLAPTRFDFLKILGNGELTKKLKISAHKFSASALEKIQKAGAEAVVLPGPAPVVKNQTRAARKSGASS